MELEGPQEPQEPQETAAPEAPPLDPIQLAAQQLGVDPHVLVDSIRLQEENRRVYEENRRRDSDNARREAALEARERQLQRFEPPQPNYEMLDPSVRPLYEEVRSMKQMFTEEREERERERQAMVEARERGAELRSHLDALNRNLPSQSQLDPNEFFERHMISLYPSGVPEGLSAAQAVQNTARFLGINVNGVAGNGYSPQRTYPSRDPKQQIVIPAGQTGITPDQQAGDQPPQIRQGEPQEQFDARARVWWENKFAGKRHQQIMRDGAKFSSG